MEFAEDAVTDAIVEFPCNVGAGACCCTAGLLWTADAADAATAAANVGAPDEFILFDVWLPLVDDAVAAATTDAAVCCVGWCCCCVWGWWWFLLGVELIILLVGAVVKQTIEEK